MNDADKEKPANPSEALIQITEHAQSQISWVRSAYGWIATLIAALIAVGFWFSYKDVRDFKAEIREQGEKVQKSQEAELELLGRKLRNDLQAEADSVRREVVKRIDDEFATQQITALVRNEAKQRIDAIADVLIQNAISNQLAPVRADFLGQLVKSKEEIRGQIEKLDEDSKQARKTEGELQSTLAEARNLLGKLDQQSEFVLTVLDAQNDDRKAYEKLVTWVNDEKYPLRSQARKAMDGIQGSYVGMFTERAYVQIPWTKNVIAEAFDFSRIQSVWQQLEPRYARDFVEFVWGHTNLNKEQKLTLLRGILKDSRNSLDAENKAAQLLAGELKAEYNPPFVLSDIDRKWDERQKTNQASVSSTNRPTATKP